MVKTIIFYHPTSQIHHHHHLPLFTLCGRRVKQSQTMRSGRFKSNLLTCPGRPNTHAWGSTSRFAHATFPLSFRVVDQGYPLRLQESTPRYDAESWDFLHPHVAAWEQCSKRVREKSTRRGDQVLKLTDYHIFRHVVSMFKRLTTTTTLCGLSIFPLNRRGFYHEHHTLTLPVSLIAAVCSKNVRTYDLASDRKSLDFYKSYLAEHLYELSI